MASVAGRICCGVNQLQLKAKVKDRPSNTRAMKSISTQRCTLLARKMVIIDTRIQKHMHTRCHHVSVSVELIHDDDTFSLRFVFLFVKNSIEINQMSTFVFSVLSGPSFTLPEGTTNYEFSFNLKAELPSSFSGGSGKIKYKMEFVVDKPWKFDERQTIVLNIVQTVNLNYSLGTLQPFENQLTRNIGYIGSGPISLHIFVPKCGYTVNDKIPVQVISIALK